MPGISRRAGRHKPRLKRRNGKPVRVATEPGRYIPGNHKRVGTMADNSIVTVVFNDGEIQDYPLSAGPGVSGYLAEQAGRTGILYMRGGETTWSIPVRNIREWKISPLQEVEGNENPDGTADA